MRGIFYLAWRYLAWHRWKSLILVAAITLVVFLPAAIQVLVDQTAAQLGVRAASTPLLIGAKGSPLELTLNSLYLQSTPPASLPFSEVDMVRQQDLATPIPLYVRFKSQGAAIVGTSLAYFDYRGLAIASGRSMAVLGEAVIGSSVARDRSLSVGDHVLSSPESAFDIAGVYPLKMPVVGILAPSFSADDNAIFVDVKTAWVIEGLGHGHQDLAAPEAARAILKKDGDTIVANASMVEYNEITEANRDSFHFHGDYSQRPLTAIIPVAKDEKSAVILAGRYQARDDDVQLISPPRVMDELMATIFTVRQFVVAALSVVGMATALVVILVFLLSLRLRQSEMNTLRSIGGGRWHLATLAAAEILMVVVVSGALAMLLTWLTERWGTTVIQALIVS
ncbi:MAG: ABC transporter permease [Halioglobus sp.]